MLTETDIPLIEATGTNKQWTFDIRGDSRSDVATFHARCREVGIPVTLTALHDLIPVETESQAALTDKQEEALVLAFNRGYLKSPRQVTMEELGAELGISQQAIAARLRNGIKHILDNTLLETEQPHQKPRKRALCIQRQS